MVFWPKLPQNREHGDQVQTQAARELRARADRVDHHAYCQAINDPENARGEQARDGHRVEREKARYGERATDDEDLVIHGCCAGFEDRDQIFVGQAFGVSERHKRDQRASSIVTGRQHVAIAMSVDVEVDLGRARSELLGNRFADLPRGGQAAQADVLVHEL